MTRLVTEDQDNRPSVYWEEIDGEAWLIIRASALGHPCMFELAAQGQGHEAVQLPGMMRRAYKEGHKLEPVVLERLVDEHGFVHHTYQVEGHLILADEKIMIRYHPDAISTVPPALGGKVSPGGSYTSLGVVVEIKAITHDAFERVIKGHVTDYIAEYAWQLSVMMYGEQLPAVHVAIDKGYPPDKDTGVKPECPGEGRIFIDPRPTPPIQWEDIKAKAIAIKEAVMGEDVMEAGECTAINHFPCQYQHLRPEPEDDDMDDDTTFYVDSDTEEGKELDKRVHDYMRYAGEAKEAKERADALRDEIIAMVPEHVKKVHTDRFIVPIQRQEYDKVDWTLVSPEAKAEIEAAKSKHKKAPFIQSVRGKA